MRENTCQRSSKCDWLNQGHVLYLGLTENITFSLKAASNGFEYFSGINIAFNYFANFFGLN